MKHRRLKLAGLILLLIAAAAFGRFAFLVAEEQQPAVAWVSRLEQQENTVLFPGRCFIQMPWQTQSHE